MRPCPRCRQPFAPKGGWQRICWNCWNSERDAKARTEVFAETYTRGYRAAMEDAPSLEPDLLKQLIGLCHPDRHPPERRLLATRITARLLSLRDERRAA